MKYKISIVGATGYTGIELIRILLKHPHIEITGLTSESYSGLKLNKILPFFNIDIQLEKFIPDNIAKKSDLVFLCLPHTKSMTAVFKMLKFGKKVIDLSGDFRLKDKALYKKWYGVQHKYPNLLKKSVYGLPEIYRDKIKKSEFVTNPGCYPTSVILGTIPALKNKLVDINDIVINSISGISGVGRKIATQYHFSETYQNIKAYKIGVHQHTPEIEQELSNICSQKIKVSFTPHLVSVNRGILTTISIKLLKKVSTQDCLKIYKGFYLNEKFIRVLPLNSYPETKYVFGTNLCDLGLKVDERLNRLIVISAIDNLVKGASGQAIQNMNLMLNLPEETALKEIGLMP
ncbi:MAG: N-acetyl-gamma-glutamyl-phosphate reductase [Candidatus Firestonebacteria bacterium]